MWWPLLICDISNTIDTHVAYALSEQLFELRRERCTVVVAHDNYCFISDITKTL